MFGRARICSQCGFCAPERAHCARALLAAQLAAFYAADPNARDLVAAAVIRATAGEATTAAAAPTATAAAIAAATNDVCAPLLLLPRSSARGAALARRLLTGLDFGCSSVPLGGAQASPSVPPFAWALWREAALSVHTCDWALHFARVLLVRRTNGWVQWALPMLAGEAKRAPSKRKAQKLKRAAPQFLLRAPSSLLLTTQRHNRKCYHY